MRKFSALKMFWTLCLLPLACFAEQEWVPSDLEILDCERKKHEVFLETTCPVHVECSYPIFSGQGVLKEYVNQQLQTVAEERFNCFVQEEVASEEIWDDECTISYDLFPVYQSPSLISVFGSNFQGKGSHGCTYYEGNNFWQKGDRVVKLILDDLFVRGSGYRPFLLQCCENYFKASGYGYYSSLPESPPQLESQDLDIFILTSKGLMIVFRAYRVGGWADGPDTVLIPYEKLKQFIDPLGPLK